MSVFKNENEIEILREGGARLARILGEAGKLVRAGITTGELDQAARRLVGESGDKASFLGYTPEGVKYPYPAALCVSVNEEIVHGIPGDRILQNGDIVSIDLGLNHGGFFTDHAITLPVGEISAEEEKLIRETKRALKEGVRAAKAGNTTGDIGFAISKIAKDAGLGIVKILAGHGVGRQVHDDPYVPNYGKEGSGERLVEGQVIAIEPMFTLGSGAAKVLKDEYTYVTKDGSKSAHFEHTVLITKNEPEILTKN